MSLYGRKIQRNILAAHKQRGHMTLEAYIGVKPKTPELLKEATNMRSSKILHGDISTPNGTHIFWWCLADEASKVLDKQREDSANREAERRMKYFKEKA